jgi:aryl-phospho-beta-D-glucosidase BglC (GH1 family)
VPVRLVGFNWSGTELGGRADNQKTADVCGMTWRTPLDPIGGSTVRYDDMYPRLASWGYNTIRLPISWNNLEPVAPVCGTGRSTSTRGI